MEDRKTVVLQSHLDMVHQKNNDTVFDFDNEGIKIIDNNCSSSDEALFTIDEETGMTGALGLKGGVLSGEILLNLDTENDNEIDIGCAGGIDVTATQSYIAEACPSDAISFELTVKANERYGLRIASLLGGSLRNAIPRESVAKVVINKDKSPHSLRN
ncbi:cytosol non-specific dipeptidase [Ditylenchus destructor]|uniref:Cytosol non-specific dipeptidase n=1 Tax=Ditylenchus destructor TaxID=166010 RepID=A0AAD4QW14_9BILA|nr:cytosol non-specific dipeptidase [Ditylenchus destructor]